jgi:hypothetical protein
VGHPNTTEVEMAIKRFRHNWVPLKEKESIRDRHVRRRARRKYKMILKAGKGRHR